MNEDILVVIPARGGSKGLPGKNIKLLGGKPLICHTIELAQKMFPVKNICVSTDSQQIREIALQAGINIPFLRPQELATDVAGSREVLLHAIQFYETQGIEYKKLLLLQPTSPFRNENHIADMICLFNQSEEMEMVVSVGVSHHNPYFSLFEENSEGYLVKSKDGKFERRQDAPPVYYFNGSAYIMDIIALKKREIVQFTNVKKYVMEEKYCLDIDTPLDWLICEALLEKGTYNNAHN